MTDLRATAFEGSIPELYDRHLVPMLFDTYARDMARRVSEKNPASVLEIAAGSGVVTREFARSTGSDTSIMSTDLSQTMLDQAIAAGTDRPVEWRQADAMDLPFEDGSFDVVLSQFGMMFVPDKARGFAEASRVLKASGAFVFSVWDRIDANGFSLAVQDGMAIRFPDDPPRFLVDAAFGYFDETRIREDLTRGGIKTDVEFEALEAESRGASPESVAVALCQSSPLKTQIELRDPAGLADATAAVADVLRERFGSADLVAPMRAIIITATVS